jgi:hypothetical protein
MPTTTPRTRPWSRAGLWPWWLRWYEAQGLPQQDHRIYALYLELLGSGVTRPGQQVADAVGCSRSTVHRAMIRMRHRMNDGWPPVISDAFYCSAAERRRLRLWQERGLTEQHDGSLTKPDRLEQMFVTPDGEQDPGMEDGRAQDRADTSVTTADRDQDPRPSVTPLDAQDPGHTRRSGRRAGRARGRYVGADQDRVRFVENDRDVEQVGDLSEEELLAQILRRKLDRALTRLPEPNRTQLVTRLRGQLGRDPTVNELKRSWFAYRRMMSDDDLDWSPY